MDHEGIRRFWDDTKAFLLTRRSRETGVFLVFVFISALFWLLQTLNGTFVMPLQVPLLLEGVPENIVVTSELPEAVEVSVRDRGTALMRYVIKPPANPVCVDFSEHDDGSLFGRVVLTHSELLPQIKSQLFSSTAIVELLPDTIEYYYSRGIRRRVAVQPCGNVHTNPLYYLVDLRTRPDSVMVWGPQEVLDTLTSIHTQSVSLDELTESTDCRVQLQVPRGLKLEPSEVELTAQVDMFTEKSVSVPIVGTNFPAGHSLRTFPGVVTVKFRVGAKDYKRITADNFVITATYEELAALPKNDKLRLQLRSLPEGVSQVRIYPEEVDFLIELSSEEE